MDPICNWVAWQTPCWGWHHIPEVGEESPHKIWDRVDPHGLRHHDPHQMKEVVDPQGEMECRGVLEGAVEVAVVVVEGVTEVEEVVTVVMEGMDI